MQSRNQREGRYAFRMNVKDIVKWLSNGYQVERPHICEFGMLSNRRHKRFGPKRGNDEA